MSPAAFVIRMIKTGMVTLMLFHVSLNIKCTTKNYDSLSASPSVCVDGDESTTRTYELEEMQGRMHGHHPKLFVYLGCFII